MLDYITSKEEAQKIAAQTIEKIDSLELSKTPYNFELWYCYFAENMPELTHVIEQIESQKTPFTDAMCLELFQEYIDSNEREQQILEQTGDRIYDSVQEIQTMLSEAKDSAESYGGSLQNVSIELSKADSMEALQKVVTTIVKETKTMMETNKALEAKLETSSEQVQELQQTLDSVKKEAMTDGLTGVANRKCFDHEIDIEMQLASAEGYKLCLLMIDIDHFKTFNDTYGHQIGDQVLKLVANTMINGIKGRDLAARYGGEEFAILLPETPLTAANKVADNLRERIANKEIVNRSNNETLGKITISVGIAEYQPGETTSELIKRADDALYKAKENGRNRVEIATNPYINVHEQM